MDEISFSGTSRNCLVYLAGYLAWKLNRKFRTDYSKLHAQSVEHPSIDETWLNLLSRGRLTVPNEYIVSAVYKCETVFLQFYELYSKSKYLFTRLCHHIRYFHGDIDENIIREFLVVRLRIKAASLNENRKSRLRRKFNKKKQFSRSSN